MIHSQILVKSIVLLFTYQVDPILMEDFGNFAEF